MRMLDQGAIGTLSCGAGRPPLFVAAPAPAPACTIAGWAFASAERNWAEAQSDFRAKLNFAAPHNSMRNRGAASPENVFPYTIIIIISSAALKHGLAALVIAPDACSRAHVDRWARPGRWDKETLTLAVAASQARRPKRKAPRTKRSAGKKRSRTHFSAEGFFEPAQRSMSRPSAS
jgi:hypothetical protein